MRTAQYCPQAERAPQVAAIWEMFTTREMIESNDLISMSTPSFVLTTQPEFSFSEMWTLNKRLKNESDFFLTNKISRGKSSENWVRGIYWAARIAMRIKKIDAFCCNDSYETIDHYWRHIDRQSPRSKVLFWNQWPFSSCKKIMR